MRLDAPDGRKVRPTSGRAREALMSILGGFFDGEQVLELCAGCGAIGLEMVSRGCGRAVLVERDRGALEAIAANIARARFGAEVRVMSGDALEAIDALASRAARFDYIFFDPPYDTDLHVSVLSKLAATSLLAGGGELIVQSLNGLDEAQLGDDWHVVDRRRYGANAFDRLEPAGARTPESE